MIKPAGKHSCATCRFNSCMLTPLVKVWKTSMGECLSGLHLSPDDISACQRRVDERVGSMCSSWEPYKAMSAEMKEPVGTK